ncbi:MAG: nucleotidyltransferase domain-containing protein [Serpentinimonas sp.]|nr:nucleotidyltransferase domain-containing protein [Serpentinimonas sp.]
MRLTEHQAKQIVELAHAMAGESAQVRVFGSRLDDAARGGDLDLMLELPESAVNPALLAARFSSRVTRLMQGRKVDVLLAAPKLMRLPIHDLAFREGEIL